MQTNIHEIEITRPGTIVSHFKRTESKGDNNYLYRVIGIGKNSETLEEQVVYQALYGTNDIWIRPKNEFCEPVDKQKYPDVKQEFKFECYEIIS